MKWIFNEPGLMQVLTLSEWAIMATVFGILILAGWMAVKFLIMAVNVMRGE